MAHLSIANAVVAFLVARALFFGVYLVVVVNRRATRAPTEETPSDDLKEPLVGEHNTPADPPRWSYVARIAASATFLAGLVALLYCIVISSPLDYTH